MVGDPLSECLPQWGKPVSSGTPGPPVRPCYRSHGGRLTRCNFRTPAMYQGDLAEGIPVHVSLPNDPGIMKAALRACRAGDFRVTVRLEKWSNRKHPRSLTRTAYRLVGGTLQGLLQDLEHQEFMPPKRDFESNKGVWHVSCWLCDSARVWAVTEQRCCLPLDKGNRRGTPVAMPDLPWNCVRT